MRFKKWMLHGIGHRLCPITPSARAAIAGEHYDCFCEEFQRQGINRAGYVRAGLVCDEASVRSMARDIDRTNIKKG